MSKVLTFLVFFLFSSCSEDQALRPTYKLSVKPLDETPTREKVFPINGVCTSGAKVKVSSEFAKESLEFICSLDERFSYSLIVKEGVEDGDYIVNVDQYGLSGGKVLERKIKVNLDYTAPSLEVISPSPGSIILPSFDFSFLCSEKNAVVTISHPSLYRGFVTHLCTSGTENQKVNLNLKGVAKGTTQKIFLDIKDKAGNAAKTKEVEYVIETDIYSINSLVLVEPASSPGNDRTPTFSASFSNYVEKGSEQELFLYTDSSCQDNVGTVSISSKTQKITSQSLSSDGVYQFYAKVKRANGSSSCFGPAVYELDTVSPSTVLTSSVLANSNTNSTAIPVNVKFSERVKGFSQTDLVVSNGTVINFSGSNDSYRFDIVPQSDGGVSVVASAGGASDLAGNPSLISNSLSWNYDGSPPAVNLTSTVTTGTNINITSIPVVARFTKPVTGFDFSDVKPVNASVSGFSGSGEVFRFNLNPTADGVVSIQIAKGVAVDAYQNLNAASNSLTWNYKKLNPQINAVDDAVANSSRNQMISLDVSLNDTASDCGTISYQVLNESNVNVSGTGPIFSITPSVVGKWSFDYRATCGNNSGVYDTAKVTGDAIACRCQAGYTYDAAIDSCTKTSYSPYTGNFGTVIRQSTNRIYSSRGYSLIDIYDSEARPFNNLEPWNVDERFKDANGRVVTPRSVRSSAQAPQIARMNDLLVSFSPHVDQQWYSLNFCYDNTDAAESDHIMGIGADNFFEFRINGAFIMKSDYGTTSFEQWNMAYFKLPPGKSHMSFRFKNRGDVYGYAFELFKNDISELEAGSLSGVGLNRMINSIDFVGQNVVVNDEAGCPADYTYDACGNQCVKTEVYLCQ